MMTYGQLTVVLDSSMAAYAMQINSLLSNLQIISAASTNTLVSSLFTTTTTVEFRLSSSEGSHSTGTGLIVINPSDFDDVQYIDFHGMTKPLTFERVLTHELIHEVLDLTDPLPYQAPLVNYLSLLQDPDFDPIGDTVRLTNEFMAQPPFGETGQMHYFNLIGPDETNQIRLIDSYTEEYVIDDVIHSTVNSVQDLVINRIGSVIGDRPTDDLIIGYDSDEQIFAGDGGDHLYDGEGNDVLDGGAGDDSFYLSDDGDSDIIVIGEGYDYIVGGDGDDRIVFRTELLGLNPAYENWSDPAGGLRTTTTAIPLLGGFITYQDGTDLEAGYTYFGEGIIQNVYYLPEDPTAYYEYTVATSGTPLWEEFVSTDEEPGASEPDMGNSFRVFYQQFEVSAGQNALYIEFEYWLDGNQVMDHIYIADFDEGDFGIQFQNRSTFAVPQESGGGTLTYNTPSHVSYINNNGSYVAVPTRPTGEQQRAAPEGYEIASGAGDGFADEIFHSDARQDVHASFNDAAVVANSARYLGNAWYEPEPTGGLV